MTVNASVFIATSLDGFIARPNGAIDWLPHGADAEGEDYGFAAFMKSVDALVMGRHTFETVKGFNPWPYGKTKVIVLSSRRIDIPRELSKTVTTLGGKVDAILGHLESLGVRHVYVDGGITIQRFLNAGAIQRMIITTIPVLIGEGIPLFGPLTNGDVTLKLVDSRSYPSGLLQRSYEVAARKRRTTTATRASKAARRVSRPSKRMKK